ncbi:PEP-CTERM sorting domain-containing protein [Niveibacterium sp. COAC-50]|uniref:PEP-CTERM sorting domain-containing protein n=1 Tax=Niveibacterium sp. COAC-50 TaxID=2729384 RepID=UPI0015547303|nr:PEP-CTERM sorting domain-containing protein [Niveibacterium sp. COAC-50]
MKTMRTFLAALVLMATALSANSADLGTLDTNLSTAVTSSSTKSFAEFVSFTIDSPSSVYAQVSGAGATGFWALFDTGLNKLSTSYVLGAYDFFNLAAGDYLLGVSIKPLFGTGYAIASAGAIPAVPEPETYALLLGGLGMIITISSRRMRR